MAKAYTDLRGFLEVLEAEGQLVHIKEEIDPEQIGAAGRAAADSKSAPALFFEKVRGYKNPVVINAHGSWENHALMMGMPKNTPVKDQFHELNRRWDKYPVEPKIIERAHAKCKEVVIDKDINLFEVLSLYRINDQDAGFFLSKACVATADAKFPDDLDKQNLGTYRIQVKDIDTVGIQALPFHDIAIHLAKVEAENKPLPVAIALGCDPITTFMASTPVLYDESEYKFVGALNDGVPCEITKADLYPNLYVPAHAEVVLEGYIKPRVREVEGPFGEFPGSYSGARLQCEIVIERITHRKDPIFENLYLGLPWTEIDYLMALNTSVPLYKQLKSTFPEIEAVNAMYTHGMGVIISTKVRLGGMGKAVAFRLLSTPHGMAYSKIIIIVDSFVDPFNLEQVMWALTTRVRPADHVSIIENCPGMPLDPSSVPAGMHSKLIIDATTPVAPEPNPRDVELLKPHKDAPKWVEYIKKYQAEHNK